MKNIKKLLALMLALVMLVCLVACDDKKSSDDTEEEEVTTEETKKDSEKDGEDNSKTAEAKEDKKTEDKKTEAASTSDELEGEWVYSVDMSEAFETALASLAGQVELPNKKVMMNITFEFDGDEFTMTAGVDKDGLEDYLDALVEVMVDYLYDMAESQGMSKDELESQFSASNGAGIEEYMEKTMKEALEGAGDELTQSEEGYFKVDTKKGRIYTAEDKDDLDDEENYMEYELSGKKLTITKIVSDGEEANPMDENLEMLEFPWTFKKQ